MKIKDIVFEGFVDYYKVNTVASQSFKEFTKLLRDNNINVGQLTPEIADKLPEYLTQWTVNYMSGGDSRKEQPKIIAKIQAIPVPSTINLITIKQYLSDAAKARQQAKEEVKNSLPTSPSPQPAQPTPAPTQQAAQPATQDSTVGRSGSTPLAPGVEVIDSDPLILRYRNQDFLLNKSDQWVRFGGKKQTFADPDMATFLNKQLTRL